MPPEAKHQISFDDPHELPLVRGSTAAQSASSHLERSHQYAQLGVFLCAHCHILLALWDGKPGTEFGGTGQVVKGPLWTQFCLRVRPAQGGGRCSIKRASVLDAEGAPKG